MSHVRHVRFFNYYFNFGNTVSEIYRSFDIISVNLTMSSTNPRKKKSMEAGWGPRVYIHSSKNAVSTSVSASDFEKYLKNVKNDVFKTLQGQNQQIYAIPFIFY